MQPRINFFNPHIAEIQIFKTKTFILFLKNMIFTSFVCPNQLNFYLS